MAYKDFSGGGFDYAHAGAGAASPDTVHLQAGGADTLSLPASSFVQDAALARDGMDLVLSGPDGKIVIDNYFAAEPPPMLMAPDGKALTPGLVDSFLKSPMEYAANAGANDSSPVGTVHEISGTATVTRADGRIETLTEGAPIYQGDIVETSGNGAVNIVFTDETSFAISQNARLSIDEYVFDPATQAGTQDFSVLKGVFVFTSGLIGRDDPDDVHIHTPSGSIGIRGTIIAGDVDKGEITVVEGAIVIKDFHGNEITLADRFESVKFTLDGGVEHAGQLSAQDVAGRYGGVSSVAPTLFSVINSEAHGNGGNNDSAGDGNNANDNSGQPGGETGHDAAPQGDASGNAPAQSGAPADGAAPGPAAAPPPPATPPATPPSGTNGGLGGNNGGFGSHASGPAAPPPPPASPPPPPAGTQGAAPPPPPPGAFNPPVPDTPPGVLNPPVDHAPPTWHGGMPAEFFASAEGLSWSYNFANDFQGAGLSFNVDQQTRDYLNSLDGTVLTGDEGTGWSIDAQGHLTLNFLNGLSGDAILSHLTITATDGHNTISHDYGGFDVYEFDSNYIAGNDSHSASSENVYVNIGASVSYPSFDLGDGSGTADTINNNVFLTGAGCPVFIAQDAEHNIIYTSDSNYDFTVSGKNNTIYSGAGNDTFTLNQNLGNTTIYAGAGNDTFTLSDDVPFGGGTWQLHGGLGTDTIAINYASDTYGSDGINFSTIRNGGSNITGIEVIDATGGNDDVITLSYDDVLAMTDDRHQLTIQLDDNGRDHVTLNGFDGFSHSTDANGHDVYTNGTVTVIVEGNTHNQVAIVP